MMNSKCISNKKSPLTDRYSAFLSVIDRAEQAERYKDRVHGTFAVLQSVIWDPTLLVTDSINRERIVLIILRGLDHILFKREFNEFMDLQSDKIEISRALTYVQGLVRQAVRGRGFTEYY